MPSSKAVKGSKDGKDLSLSTANSTIAANQQQESVFATIYRVASSQLGDSLLPVYQIIAISCLFALLTLFLGTVVWHFAFFSKAMLSVEASIVLLPPAFLGFCLIYDDHPRVAYILLAVIFGVMAGPWLSAMMLVPGLLSPFPLQDHLLAFLDAHYFHFSEAAFATYCAHNFGVWLTVFKLFYASWHVVVFAPLFYFAWYKDTYNLVRAIFITFMTMLIGYILFYLVPAVGPANAFPNCLHLVQLEKGLAHAIVLMHQGIEPTTLVDYALVTFPSYHVIDALLVAYFFFASSVWRWPTIIWTAMTVLSTLVIGEHYLVDVLAGFAVVLVSIPLANWLLRPYAKRYGPASESMV